MGEAIRVDWYDLDAAGEREFLDWCHGDYLPGLKALPGIAWLGHYRIVRKPDRASVVVPGRLRRETDDRNVGRGQGFVLLTATASPDVFFASGDPVSALENRHPAMLDLRREHRQAVFVEEAVVNGPEYRALVGGAGAPPAIQLGGFNVASVEDEWELARNYRQEKFPQVTVARGCIRARKLLAVVGWSKHGILYEFDGMDEGETLFEPRFAAASRGGPKRRHVLEYVIHAPNAPHAGRRIWPPPDG